MEKTKKNLMWPRDLRDNIKWSNKIWGEASEREQKGIWGNQSQSRGTIYFVSIYCNKLVSEI